MDWRTLLSGLLATHALLFLGALIMLLLLAGMLRQKRSPSASAAWLVFMIAVPYAGVPLYLVFGTRKLKALVTEKPHRLDRPQLASATDNGLQQFLGTLQVSPPSPTGPVYFHPDATAARHALFTLLETAQSSIDISIFILGRDRVGRQVLELLTRRAAEGLSVRLLLDGVGSFYLFKRHLRPFVKAGGRVAWFIPVLHVPLRGRTNMRNHRKLVIADKVRAWTGGRNIADDYLLPEAQTRWIDLSFDLQGPGVGDYVALFDADWAFASRHSASPTPANTIVSPDSTATTHLSQLLASGPDRQDDVLHETLTRLLMEARSRIVVVTPYFIPSDILQSLLCVSARSGVKVEVLVPEKSNHHLADFARQRFLRQLHQAGASIRCLPDAMLHAKAIVIDDRYALVGSANFDLRSLYLNFELMSLFHHRLDIMALLDWIDGLRSNCMTWTPDPPGELRQTLEGLVLLVAFQL